LFSNIRPGPESMRGGEKPAVGLGAIGARTAVLGFLLKLMFPYIRNTQEK